MNVRGLRVVALMDEHGAIWFNDPDLRPDVFRCTVGDRTLHIDELAPPKPRKPPTTAT